MAVPFHFYFMATAVAIGLLFDSLARFRALRRAPRGSHRFTCVDTNKKGGVRVLVVNERGYAVYLRSMCEAQITFDEIQSVQAIRSRGLIRKRELIGLKVLARDGRGAFYLVNGYVGIFGHAKRAQQLAAIINAKISPMPVGSAFPFKDH